MCMGVILSFGKYFVFCILDRTYSDMCMRIQRQRMHWIDYFALRQFLLFTLPSLAGCDVTRPPHVIN